MSLLRFVLMASVALGIYYVFSHFDILDIVSFTFIGLSVVLLTVATMRVLRGVDDG